MLRRDALVLVQNARARLGQVESIIRNGYITHETLSDSEECAIESLLSEAISSAVGLMDGILQLLEVIQ
jgi:hypothetical protein